MTKFENNFYKISTILEEKKISDYKELIELVKLLFKPLEKKIGMVGIIVLGYSGNGKSTWIKSFLRNNKGYDVVSWDGEIIKNLNGRKYNEVSGEEQIRLVGNAIEETAKKQRNIVLDGNYLNLPLRVAIINTLHELGYEVHLIDLTPIIDITLKNRIIEEIYRFKQMPKYSKVPLESLVNIVTKKILEFKENEEFRSSFNYQKDNGVVAFGVEEVYHHNSQTSK